MSKRHINPSQSVIILGSLWGTRHTYPGHVVPYYIVIIITFYYLVENAMLQYLGIMGNIDIGRKFSSVSLVSFWYYIHSFPVSQYVPIVQELIEIVGLLIRMSFLWWLWSNFPGYIYKSKNKQKIKNGDTDTENTHFNSFLFYTNWPQYGNVMAQMLPWWSLIILQYLKWLDSIELKT